MARAIPVYRSIDGRRFSLSRRGTAAKCGEYRLAWDGYAETHAWLYMPEPGDWDRPQPPGEWIAANEPRGA